MRERVLQPVSFNMLDSYEKELYEFAIAQQKYFSKYIKYLIEKDRSNQDFHPQVVDSLTQPKQKDADIKNKKAALDFL